MSTNFPSSLDNFTNPASTDLMNSVTVPHNEQHANANDAIEALQAKVGVDGSAVTSSHDYILTNGVLPTLNVDSGVLVVDDTNNRVGVNDATPSYALDVDGDINATGVIRVDGEDIHEVTVVEETVTIANATNTTPAFNTEIIDVGGWHASGSNNIYIPYDGIYLLTASMYAVNSVNRALITIRKHSGGSGSDLVSQDNNSGGNDLTVSTQEKLLSGDYVFLNMWQNSGVTQTPVVRLGVSLVRKL